MTLRRAEQGRGSLNYNYNYYNVTATATSPTTALPTTPNTTPTTTPTPFMSQRSEERMRDIGTNLAASSLFTSLNTLVCLNDSYKFYEAVQVGPYTIQFWSVSSLQGPSCSPPVATIPSGIVQIKSYLPPGTYGMKLPHFSTTFKNSKGSPTATQSQLGNTVWQVTIYKDGLLIDPREEKELRDFEWIRNTRGAWMNKVFTKEQLCKLMKDITTKYEPNSATPFSFEKLSLGEYGPNTFLLGMV
eukprot:TRINITY_DN17396_c0_g1_i1.p1 TRINITY_DN17396_c0_g1~~TRINITY_DN17396_c0_g1_i1.p1  ORF type:complete len:244 (-),score=28.05 TRINITY_DN17396_c0_g1_i1:32-763(-)